MKQRFFLRDERIKGNAKAVLEQLPTDNENPLVLEIKPLTRTLEQNAKLHAMLTDISKQCEFQGRRISVEQWKMVFCSAHAIATGKPAEMAIGLEGEVINLRESTAQMSVKRLASLITYVEAWGVGNGVHFNDRFGFYGY